MEIINETLKKIEQLEKDCLCDKVFRQEVRKLINQPTYLETLEADKKERQKKSKEQKDREYFIQMCNRVQMPFHSNEFTAMWLNWMMYKKKEYGFQYKSEISLQGSLNGLVKKANGEEDTAIKIIVQSIENGWKGFFELKTNNNGTKQNNGISQDYLQRVANGL